MNRNSSSSTKTFCGLGNSFAYIFIDFNLIQRSKCCSLTVSMKHSRSVSNQSRRTCFSVQHIERIFSELLCHFVIKELVYAFSCTYIDLWIHLGSSESTREARVTVGYASGNSYASLLLSKLPARIDNSIYAR